MYPRFVQKLSVGMPPRIAIFGAVIAEAAPLTLCVRTKVSQQH